MRRRPGALQSRSSEDFSLDATSQLGGEPLVYLARSIPALACIPSLPAPGGTSWRPDATQERRTGLSSRASPKLAPMAGGEGCFSAHPNPPWNQGLGGCGPLEGAAGSTCSPTKKPDGCPLSRALTRGAGSGRACSLLHGALAPVGASLEGMQSPWGASPNVALLAAPKTGCWGGLRVSAFPFPLNTVTLSCFNIKYYVYSPLWA